MLTGGKDSLGDGGDAMPLDIENTKRNVTSAGHRERDIRRRVEWIGISA